MKIKTTSICNCCGVPYGWPHQDQCAYVRDTKTLTSVYVDVLGARERCRHGTTFWCEDCVNDAYKLHTSLGFEAGLSHAVSLLRNEAALNYTNHKDDTAYAIRAMVDTLTKKLDEVKSASHDIRKEQMPEYFK